MDENKFPEQEDNWLDDVLGPEAAGAELGPDESALFNEHLIDPGAPAAESPEIPEALPDENPLLEMDGSNAESAPDMSSTQLLMNAADALIAGQPVPEEIPEVAIEEEALIVLFNCSFSVFNDAISSL